MNSALDTGQAHTKMPHAREEAGFKKNVETPVGALRLQAHN